MNLNKLMVMVIVTMRFLSQKYKEKTIREMYK